MRAKTQARQEPAGLEPYTRVGLSLWVIGADFGVSALRIPDQVGHRERSEKCHVRPFINAVANNAATDAVTSSNVSIDLQPERPYNRRPEGNIGSQRLPEFFRVRIESGFDTRIEQ
jgi:hypothetical protein